MSEVPAVSFRHRYPVRIELGGLRICSRPETPVALAGRLLPWSQLVLRGDFVAPCEPDGTRLRLDGRPVNLRLNGSGSMVAAAKLQCRALKRALADGSLDVHQVFASPLPGRLFGIGVTVAGFGALSWIIGSAAPSFWASRGQLPPHLQTLAAAVACLMVAVLISSAGVYVAIVLRATSQNVARLRFGAKGIEATWADGRTTESRWQDLVQSSKDFTRTLSFSDETTIRFATDSRTRVLLDAISERFDPAGPDREFRQFRASIIRCFVWAFFAGLGSAWLAAWMQSHGTPIGSPWRIALGTGLGVPVYLGLALLGAHWRRGRRIGRRTDSKHGAAPAS